MNDVTIGNKRVIGTLVRIPMKDGKIQPLLIIFDVVKEDRPKVSLDVAVQRLGVNPNDVLATLANLANAFAPDVAGLWEHKIALLAQVVGSYDFDPLTKMRYTIHGIAIGEASTAKSLMARRICQILDKCIMTDGANTTIKSLTAAIDPETKQISIGPLAAFDGDPENFGLVVINEAQHLKSPTELTIPLEDQQYTDVKGGKTFSVKTRASVLVIMNPTGNYWDPGHVLDNFPKGWQKPEVLSRYDFIAVFVSPRRLTEFTSIVRTMLNRMTGKLPAPLIDELSVYIKSARKLRPKITDDVSEYIIEKMGELYNQWEQYEIRVLPRTTEALVRLSMALARLTWSSVVTKQHVDIAYKIAIGLSEYMREPIERGILSAALSASENKLIRTVLAFLRDNCPVCGSEDERVAPCNKYEIAKQIQATIEQDPEANSTLVEALSRKGYSTFTAWFDERALRILNEAGYILINGPKICVITNNKE